MLVCPDEAASASTVELVLRLHTVDNLAHAQTIVVVFEFYDHARLRHLRHLRIEAET